MLSLVDSAYRDSGGKIEAASAEEVNCSNARRSIQGDEKSEKVPYSSNI
jgi:hypothetical protein